MKTVGADNSKHLTFNGLQKRGAIIWREGQESNAPLGILSNSIK